MTTSDDSERAMRPETRFGALVRDRRKAMGASQEAFAEALRAEGVPSTQAQVSRIEQGERPIRLDEAAIICRVLEIDPVEALAAALTAEGDPAGMNERAAWQEVLLAQRALLQQCAAWIEGKNEILRLHTAVEEALIAWGAAFTSADRPPLRDLDRVQESINHAMQQLGEGYR